MVNLLSNDVNRFDIAIIFFHYLWIAPLQACIFCYFTYMIVGWYTFLGLFFLVLQIPLQGEFVFLRNLFLILGIVSVFMGKRSSVYRLRTALRTDERVRLMNEIINGIQVIKMYAWELPFSKLVEQARKKEIHEIRGSSNIRGVLLSLYIFSSRSSIFLTIIGYALSGQYITADVVFLLTAFYNTLRNAMTIFFPMAITQLAEALISVQRIEAS